MKKQFFYVCVCLTLCSVEAVWASNKSDLTHIEGVHAIGLRAGTGWGNTWDVGLSYQYYWGRHWSVSALVDVEKGRFDQADFFGLKVAPGVEAAVWHPLTWMFLHLNSHLRLGCDWWSDEGIQKKQAGFTLGCSVGFNLEMYAHPSFSFLLGAEQHFDYGFYPAETPYYFSPLFHAGIRYNIR